LESDGEKLARRLRDAGNRVTNHIYPGATHEFFGMAPIVRAAAEAQALAAKNLRDAFWQGRQPPEPAGVTTPLPPPV
jgi:acetyl esterase/lipase